jgi:hypothetical protein
VCEYFKMVYESIKVGHMGKGAINY